MAVASSYEPSWRYNAAHAAAVDDLDLNATSGPAFDGPTKAMQLAAGEAVRSAIAGAQAGSNVSIEPGHYRFSGNVTLTVPHGVTIDGQGSTFWMQSGTLNLVHCNETTIKGITLDAYPHTHAQGRVTAVDRMAQTVEVTDLSATDPGYAVLTTMTTPMAWYRPGTGKFVDLPNGVTLAAATKSGAVLTLRGRIGWLERFEALVGTVKVGDVVDVPVPTANPLISIEDTCTGVVLENVRVYSGSPAVKDESGATFADVVVTRRPGTGRLLGAAGHGIASEADTTIRRSVVGHSFGDGVCAGGAFGIVCSPAGLNAAVVASPVPPPATCAFYDPLHRTLGNVAVVATPVSDNALLNATAAALSFPAMTGWGLYGLSWQPDVSSIARGTVVDVGSRARCVVTDSCVRGCLGYGIALSSPGEIANTFVESCDVFVGPEARVAYRGPYPRDVAVSNNFVVRGSVVAGAWSKAASAVHVGIGAKPMSNVRIARNVVRSPMLNNTPAPGVQAYYLDATSQVTDNLIAPDVPTSSFPCGSADAVFSASNVHVAVGSCDALVTRNSGPLFVVPTNSRNVPRVPYSVDDPPGPQFTASQIAQHKANGAAMMQTVLAAASNLSVSEFVIPPGDYGFDMTVKLSRYDAGGMAAMMINVKRPDDNPFTLNAYGVTFWADNSLPARPMYGYAFIMAGCDNVHVKGLTVDQYVPSNVEGKVKKIDVAGNRILMDLLPGTLSDMTLVSGFPFGMAVCCKPDGTYITPFYNVAGEGSWGPGHVSVTISPGTSPTEAWFTFNTSTFMQTTTGPRWYDAHGVRGSLSVGDAVSVNVRTVQGFGVVGCKHIRLTDCSQYVGGIIDNGGHGGHVFTNHRMCRRPGTNQVVGAGNQLGGRMRVGSVWEGLYMGPTIDDPFNIMAYTGPRATQISGNSMVLTCPSGLQAGDTVEFFVNDKTLAYTYTIASITALPPYYGIDPAYGNIDFGFLVATVVCTTPVWSGLDNAAYKAYFPSCKCAGWTIRNSVFDGCYQRLLFQTGPGLFENNIVRGMGDYLMCITHISPEGEGGFADDVVVRNNAFLECGLSSDTPPILAPSYADAPIRGLEVRDNAVVGCTDSAIYLQNVADGRIEDNIVVDCLRRGFLTGQTTRVNAITASACANVLIANTSVFQIEDRASTTFDRVASCPPFINNMTLRNNVLRMDRGRVVHDAAFGAYAAGANAAVIIAACRDAARKVQ